MSAVRPTCPAALPPRVYVVTGKPHQPYNEPSYSTDPRTYGVFLKPEMPDEEYAKVRDSVKAFVNRDDAIDFAYHCNLVGVMCPVFDRVDDRWIYNELETSRIADDIN
jgi:hypothetical protein